MKNAKKIVKNLISVVNDDFDVTSVLNELMIENNANKVDDTLVTRNFIYDTYKKYKVLSTYDTTDYIGCDNGITKRNIFSANVKKSRCNIYCDDICFYVIEQLQLSNNTLLIKNGNSVDKIRNNTIECKSSIDFDLIVNALVSNKCLRMLPTN